MGEEGMTDTASTVRRDGWISMIGVGEAEGELRELYARIWAGGALRPAVYTPPTGDVANIVKSHSLEPEGLRLAFGMSAAIHWSARSLPWATREMINTVTSSTNNCFY
jgi:hypothetical protein